MPLVKMSKLLLRARRDGRGCASFSVYSMESLIGVMRAAEESGTALILQLAEARFGTAPLELMGPMMIAAAKNSELEIAVHLDHGTSFSAIQRALELGFRSVMYDGSLLPFEENVEGSRRAVEMARAFDADVEAELGLIGKGEGGGKDHGILYTRADDAEEFVRRTGVDALAIAIGNKHGNYTGEPKLRFDILREIHGRIPDELLVLHGGSGISDADFRRSIKEGITKINIATAIADAVVRASGDYLSSVRRDGRADFYRMSGRIAEEVREVAEHHIRVFNGEEL